MVLSFECILHKLTNTVKWPARETERGSLYRAAGDKAELTQHATTNGNHGHWPSQASALVPQQDTGQEDE